MAAPPTSTRELPVSFSSFVVSLASSAMMHLGEGPPSPEAPPVDLQLAKHTIDVLALLRTKTAGNLDEEESNLLEALLYETRMKYLEKTRAD